MWVAGLLLRIRLVWPLLPVCWRLVSRLLIAWLLVAGILIARLLAVPRILTLVHGLLTGRWISGSCHATRLGVCRIAIGAASVVSRPWSVVIAGPVDIRAANAEI